MRDMKLYRELAEWWPLVSTPSDYQGEAELYRDLLVAASGTRPVEVLELGCGGGNNASHMKRWFTMTLVDISPDMLAVSRALNPECPHLLGDMRTVRLGRTFDAVFVHDAVMYMLDESELRAALATAAAHTRPGGVCVIVPDATAETVHHGTHHGGHDDAASGRSVRYLEWTMPPAPGATFQEVHFVFILKECDGNVRVIHDEHRFGRFPRATWLRLLDEVGFAVTVHPLAHEDGATNEAFVGVKR
ncbi:MAG: type 11 methyltransferase [Myxococcales bacterium]|nr:type 11 methyltransferase [Myxococcales bacterium]